MIPGLGARAKPYQARPHRAASVTPRPRPSRSHGTPASSTGREEDASSRPAVHRQRSAATSLVPPFAAASWVAAPSAQSCSPIRDAATIAATTAVARMRPPTRLHLVPVPFTEHLPWPDEDAAQTLSSPLSARCFLHERSMIEHCAGGAIRSHSWSRRVRARMGSRRVCLRPDRSQHSRRTRSSRGQFVSCSDGIHSARRNGGALATTTGTCDSPTPRDVPVRSSQLSRPPG